MTHELFRSIGQPLSEYLEIHQAPVLAETGSGLWPLPATTTSWL